VTDRPDPDRVASRAELLPEEEQAGSDNPTVQAARVLEESEQRTLERAKGPTNDGEHRRSEDTVDPT
jgi:hypothetical protein